MKTLTVSQTSLAFYDSFEEYWLRFCRIVTGIGVLAPLRIEMKKVGETVLHTERVIKVEA